jgi:hypothetical protein
MNFSKETFLTREYCPTKETVFSEMGHNSPVNYVQGERGEKGIVVTSEYCPERQNSPEHII